MNAGGFAGDARTLGVAVHTLGRECGVDASIVHDGAKVILGGAKRI